MKSSFIGRIEEKNKLCSVLNKHNSDNPAIISIGGPGGVGKSTLLDESLYDIKCKHTDILVIKVSNNEIKSFEKIIEEDFLKSAKQAIDGGYGYFKETERTLKQIEEIDFEIEKNFRKEMKKTKKLTDSEIDSFVNIFFALGKGINQYASKTEEYINFSKVEESIDSDIKNIWRKANNDFSTDFLSNIIPDFGGQKGFRDKVRANRTLCLAEALELDLHTVLYGAKDIKQKVKPTQSKIKKYNKLLIILEDFENKQDIMHDFLIDYFLPKLQTAKFESTIIVVGRDIITNIHSDWSQKFNKNIVVECDLDKFSEDEALVYLKMMGITDQVSVDKLICETEGYPWLLELEIENIKSQKGGAHTNKMFYDRTSRWMNIIQKRWFENLCYLDVVNLDTIKKVLSDVDAEEVYTWFENEPSIRDASLEHYQVKPIIRKRILKYLETKSPSLHKARMSQSNN